MRLWTKVIAACCAAVWAQQLCAQTWVWQNPYPTGYTLNDITFMDENQGWAVGGPGDILHTTDGGVTWSTRHVSPMIQAKKICFANALQGWVFGRGECAFHTSDGGATWVPQWFGSTLRLKGAVFADELHGWAVGTYDSLDLSPGILIRTADGGEHWELQEIPVSIELWAASFPDTVHGWVTGYDWGEDQGVIFHTSNGGDNWSLQYAGAASEYMRSASFVDSLHGWVSGGRWAGSYSPTILHTTDGGITWESQACPLNIMIEPIVFLDSTTGWASGFDHSFIHTTDGGETWLQQSYPADQTISAYSALDAERLWAAGESGMVLQSTDGGTHWTILSHGTSDYLNDIAFADRSNGWAVGQTLTTYDGVLLHTTNGGSTWDLQSAVPATAWYGVDALTANSVWISGGFGTVGHSTDGGIHWDTTVVYRDTSALEAIRFTDELHGWAVGEAYSGGVNSPLVFHTADGGAEWEQQNVAGIDYVWDVAFCDPMTGWIVGENGSILHTTDSGELWTLQNEGLNSVPLHSVSFVDAQHGWVCGYVFPTGNSVLLRTSDGGEHWESLPCGSNRYLTDVVFLDQQNGWMIANTDPDLTSGILRTTDGGNTWTTMDTGGDYWARNLAVVDDGAVWVVGSGGVIRHFETPESITPKESKFNLPHSYALSVYPNPFNPETTLAFDVPMMGRLRIAVYDVLGREVRVLADKVFAQGAHRIQFDGSALPSGAYFVRLDAGAISRTQKILLLK
jgi:photosystem II stability/assembly factor-like uncharacterized protein